MTTPYVELHAKSFYSFGMGASHSHELLAQARTYGYDSLALTDTNLCGALEFARLAGSLGIRPITGGELTLTDGTRLALLASDPPRLRQPLPAVHSRQCRGPQRATTGPQAPATPCGGVDPPQRGPGRARVEAAT